MKSNHTKTHHRDNTRNYHTMTTDLIDSGIGEEGRLRFILECIDKNKPLYKTDIKFLESMTEQLESKIKRLEGNNAKRNTATSTLKEKNHPKILLSDEFLDEHLDKN